MKYSEVFCLLLFSLLFKRKKAKGMALVSCDHIKQKHLINAKNRESRYKQIANPSPHFPQRIV
jgi:hypothetical protein